MTDRKLREILAHGYRATVLRQGSVNDAIDAFKSAAADPKFMKTAIAELKAIQKIKSPNLQRRCSASAANQRFLETAIHAVKS